jgi:hypothetical protein
LEEKVKKGDFWNFLVPYSTQLYLPPLTFHCVEDAGSYPGLDEISSTEKVKSLIPKG